MGVTGLWTIVQPCARPVKLETLARKRLAVDASIWIYQFLKAVRDKEGHALRNSHVIGFFRRICKLLFHGIKPVFVFDGGAPVLKRQTIAGRKSRREGRREDARRTAARILALQVQREADQEAARRKRRVETGRRDEEEEVIPDDVVYVDELLQTPEQIKRNRRGGFRKTDPYHLPDLDDSLQNMGQPNDPRIMSTEELEEYARQFRGGEEMSVYDFSKIDFDSPFFCSLPAADQYNILNAARLRSRLRMGLSKEQLDAMFPNRLDFSKFQIERVRERNELTQRLMNLNGMNDVNTLDISRVAGEKGREYVLVRNEGVEGGWALGVVGQKGEREGEKEKPIVLDTTDKTPDEDEVWEDEEDFEDVPIEGLNRLPTIQVDWDARDEFEDREDYNLLDDAEAQMMRRALYESRREAFGSGNTRGSPSRTNEKQKRPINNPNPLFLGADEEDDEEYYRNPGLSTPIDDPDSDYEGKYPHDDVVLHEAIRISLEVPGAASSSHYENEYRANDVFIGRDLSDIAEEEEDEEEEEEEEDDDDDEEIIGKGKGKAIERRPLNTREFVAIAPKPAGLTTNDHNFQKAIEESKRAQNIKPSDSGYNKPGQSSKESPSIALAPTSSNPFGGLLPFESLNLSGSKSFLTKKKVPEEKDEVKPSEPKLKQKEKECARENPDEESLPLPPWFVGGGDTSDLKAKMEKANREKEDFIREKEADQERIRIEREEMKRREKENAIMVESDDEDDVVMVDGPLSKDRVKTMDDVADRVRAMPPKTVPEEALLKEGGGIAGSRLESLKSTIGKGIDVEDSDEELEWEESDYEGAAASKKLSKSPQTDLTSTEKTTTPRPDIDSMMPADSPPPPDFDEPDFPRDPTPPFDDEEENPYSDPEDAELLNQLAAEHSEHARFAAELNNRPESHSKEDFERELKALRAQQAKDRRDADEVTTVMIQECQQLLKLFGIPYITAPMEAEAQCAELVHLGLVDGIVTDDSDTFLFGGTRVYKNMFNQAKFVECYLASDLEKEFSLDRKNLIRVAHLLGSDYTEGLPSVGPVTALELLVEFSGEDGLEEFKDWWTAVQQGVSKPIDDGKNKFRKKFVSPPTYRYFTPILTHPLA